MLVKSQVKYIQSLGHKKFRDQEGVFVAEGPKLVGELLRSPNCKPVHIYGIAEWLGREEETLAALSSAPVTCVDPGELERVSSLTTPNEVTAIFTKPRFPPFSAGEEMLLLLDGIQDPGNLGTIVRTADWFGLTRIACSRDSADLYNAKAIQSTMGSITRVDAWYGDLAGLIADHPGLPVLGALLDGRDAGGMERLQAGFLVIGNESRGIRPELLEKIQVPLTIPRIGQAESLNAAVATGILLSHLVGK